MPVRAVVGTKVGAAAMRNLAQSLTDVQGSDGPGLLASTSTSHKCYLMKTVVLATHGEVTMTILGAYFFSDVGGGGDGGVAEGSKEE